MRVPRQRKNLRSVTGVVADEAGEGQRLVHYKQASPELIQREAEELHRIATSIAAMDGITALRLGKFPPDDGVLLTQYVAESQSLFNYLWNGSRWWVRNGFAPLSPEECARRIGHWLHVYHASTLVQQADVRAHVAWMVDGVAGRLRGAAHRDPKCLPPGLHERLQAFLNQAAEHAHQWAPERIARIHGDLETANILVTRLGELVVTDFADVREGFVLFDLFRIWHAVWAIAQTSARRARLLQPFLDTLLSSYGYPASVLQSPLVRLIRLWNASAIILTASMARRELGLSGRRIVQRLADVNTNWLLSVDWR